MVNEDLDERVIQVPRADPIYQTYIWRQDSITLARLRPVLMQLQDVVVQPCVLGAVPYTCQIQDGGAPCNPCKIRTIKESLFGPSVQPSNFEEQP